MTVVLPSDQSGAPATDHVVVARRNPPAVAVPRPIRLSDHVYQVAGEKLSHPFDATAYLVTGRRPVLIDCGTAFGWPAIRQNLALLGLGPSDIVAVLATHCHFDHVSGFAAWSAGSAARLLIHPADAAAAATGDADRTSAFLYGADAPPLPVAGSLPDMFSTDPVDIRAIHTPGHTPGSTCFIVDDASTRILVAGDTLFGGYHPRIGSDLDAWGRSLERLSEEQYDYLAVGHAHPPLLPNARRIVAEARLQLGVYFHPWFRPFHLDFSC